MTEKYDSVVIGAGQAGPALAERLGAAGQRVAVIERKHPGGTCVNVGCIPTKTLVGSAKVAFTAREAQAFGVNVGDVQVDMKRVKQRKDEVAGASRDGVTGWLEGMKNVDFIRGHARLTGPHDIEVNDLNLQADQIFINVGARARVPDWPGLADIPYFTNSSMMEVDFLPEHLVVVGGSYIGLEFAQLYRRFGSEVTVIETKDRLIAREDPDISEAIQDILQGEGINLRLNAECLEPGPQVGAGLSVRVSCDQGPEHVEGSHLLLAVGRIPNTHDLGLEAAGVEVNERGFITVDDHLRTSVPSIWALGEVNGRGAFTHTSYNDYEIVAANLLDDDARSVSDRLDCYGLFVDPPLGRVGMTEEQARARGHRLLIGKRSMTRVGRAKEFGETRGFMKVVVDADTQRILGAAILGLSGDEAIHNLLPAMYADLPYTVISRSVHIHPTVTELIPTVLQSMEPG